MKFDPIVREVGKVLLGKDEQVKLCLCCLLARGHLLLEDLPGAGKTTLARALVKITGLDYQRIQFTSDLLPADVVGVSIFDRRESGFHFHPGPIFTQILLVDEVNRASPKTQSALLEAMAEYQVTVEGETRALPQPFFVIATQNPIFQSGTFALPESQLDRFLMRMSLGYPDTESERRLLAGEPVAQNLERLQPMLGAEQLLEQQQRVTAVKVRDGVLEYVQRLVAFSRTDSHYAYGLSTRASMALLQCTKAWALIHDREHVLPEDVQQVLEPVVGHRLQAAQGISANAHSLVRRMLSLVPVIA